MDQLYLTLSNKRNHIVVFLTTICLLTAGMVAVATSPIRLTTNVESIPRDYTESENDYNLFVDGASEEIYTSGDMYTTVTLDSFETTESFTSQESFESINTNISSSDKDLIMLSDNDAWNLISGGLFTSYPTQSYSKIKSQVEQIYTNKMCMITVRCWYWNNPSDDIDMSKKTVEKKFAVNEEVAQLFIDVFEDIYNDPSQPVININDAGMGTWVLRGKNHSNSSTLSGHSIGTTIDLNPSTGSFQINGTWYGNGYGHKAMPYSTWNQLPECHKKYQVLYKDCSIVRIFKSYGFVWGGDWSSGTDCMHFSFLGDGSNARIKGQSNYLQYN